MSDNNELLKGIPTPNGASAAPSTDTGNVPKVSAEDDDTRTRKTVKLSAAGMMPNMGGAPKVSPADLAVSRAVPGAPPVGGAAPEAPTVRLRPMGGAVPRMPGAAAPGATPAAAPSTDTGSVPKQSSEDTRTRRTVRISAASVEDTVRLQRENTPPPAPPVGGAVPPAPAAAAKPKLTIPTPAKPAAPTIPTPAAPAAVPAAEAPIGRGRKEKAALTLKKDESAPSGPSRVEKDIAAIAGKKSSAGAGDASQLYTVLAVIAVIALIATAVFSSQYLNVWTPDWAGGFTILSGK
ncbi:MAG: hypothetical protein PHI85_06130 [Victivallaceae bacterium]|nr:hypothetical protein [Victivallaceae bacterium]